MNYSIKYVSTITGLSEHRIRAWEKRYQLLTPERSQKGRRLYNDEDIETLSAIGKLIEKGAKIGELAPMSTKELNELLSKQRHTLPSQQGRKLSEQERILKHYILGQAIKEQRLDLLEHELTRAREISYVSFFDDVLVPFIKLARTSHSNLHYLIHERLKSLFYELSDSASIQGQPLIVATLEDGDSEIDSWLCALKLLLDGNFVIHLGKLASAEVLVEFSAGLGPGKIILTDKIDRFGKEWKAESELYEAFNRSRATGAGQDLEILVYLQGLSTPLYCPFFTQRTKTHAFNSLESMSCHLKPLAS
jgi:DNA-binding transcriptional MerR regulator